MFYMCFMMFSESHTDRLRDRDNAAGIGDNSAEIGDNPAEIGDCAAGIVDIAANVIPC